MHLKLLRCWCLAQLTASITLTFMSRCKDLMLKKLLSGSPADTRHVAVFECHYEAVFKYVAGCYGAIRSAETVIALELMLIRLQW